VRPAAQARPASPALAAIVLAAGRGRRFGGPKLVTPLEGRPLVAHVVEALRAARPRGVSLAEVVVVTGFHAEVVEAALAPEVGGAIRLVRNPEPGRGLSSSIAVGLEALDPSIEACFLVLGDQPRLSPATIEALAERQTSASAAGPTAGPASPAIIVPRYAGGGGRNPVLLDRRAWPLAAAIEGDVGLRAVIAAHPELADIVDIPGTNPDVDTPDDLARA